MVFIPAVHNFHLGPKGANFIDLYICECLTAFYCCGNNQSN